VTLSSRNFRVMARRVYFRPKPFQQTAREGFRLLVERPPRRGKNLCKTFENALFQTVAGCYALCLAACSAVRAVDGSTRGGKPMSTLSVVPDIVSAASGNLENLGSALRNASAAAACQTTAVAAPAADEVSAAVAALLGTHAQEFQTLNAQAAAFHDEFVNRLSGGAAQYVSTELANAQQTLLSAVNAPAQALIGTGQGTAAVAAANAADVIPNDFGGISINYPLGPLQLALNATPTFFSDGGLALTGVGSVTLNTPLGSALLASASVGEGISADGSFFGNILENFPFGAWVTVDVTGAFTPFPLPTYLAYNFDGLQFSVPGTSLLGPLVPNVSWNPIP
jgi:hypothetical protein